MNINAVLVSTTNIQFACYIGEEGEVTYTDSGYAYFYTEETRNRFAFRTSFIQNYEYDNDEIVIHTLNSIYKFKIIGEMQKPPVVKLSACKKQILAYMNSVKSNVFSCVALDGFVGFVKFKERFSRKEALEVIDKTPCFDSNGNLVLNIHVPQEQNMIYGLKVEQKGDTSFVCVSEFEKIGLVECLARFMFDKKIYKYDNKEYIATKEVRKFFVV